MDHQLLALIVTAGSLGFMHTLLGPDHYVPFIAIAEARQWSVRKTAWFAGICGLGHVGLSFLIGLLGLRLNVQLHHLEAFESLRGGFFGWLVISAGLVYMIIGMRKMFRHHFRESVDEELKGRKNDEAKGKPGLLHWVIFLIFIYGPCEPLVPVLLVPANQLGLPQLILVASVFGIVTILTMEALILAPQLGLKQLNKSRIRPYIHSIAGALILVCGIGIQFLGW